MLFMRFAPGPGVVWLLALIRVEMPRHRFGAYGLGGSLLVNAEMAQASKERLCNPELDFPGEPLC
jgi:hypothetical protein